MIKRDGQYRRKSIDLVEGLIEGLKHFPLFLEAFSLRPKGLKILKAFRPLGDHWELFHPAKIEVIHVPEGKPDPLYVYPEDVEAVPLGPRMNEPDSIDNPPSEDLPIRYHNPEEAPSHHARRHLHGNGTSGHFYVVFTGRYLGIYTRVFHVKEILKAEPFSIVTDYPSHRRAHEAWDYAYENGFTTRGSSLELGCHLDKPGFHRPGAQVFVLAFTAHGLRQLCKFMGSLGLNAGASCRGTKHKPTSMTMLSQTGLSVFDRWLQPRCTPQETPLILATHLATQARQQYSGMVVVLRVVVFIVRFIPVWIVAEGVGMAAVAAAAREANCHQKSVTCPAVMALRRTNLVTAIFLPGKWSLNCDSVNTAVLRNTRHAIIIMRQEGKRTVDGTHKNADGDVYNDVMSEEQG
ncbi:hypothetical protein DL96DRAFT_1565612 [Flagelloscypha sp. PMI_526]|nr:hypothetical protein DL96DRAFT_1565612 [Flagelloscypha sp. PMI_526]